MDLASKYFNDIDWRYVDHSSGLAPMQSFAFDDTFSESVGKVFMIRAYHSLKMVFDI